MKCKQIRGQEKILHIFPAEDISNELYIYIPLEGWQIV